MRFSIFGIPIRIQPFFFLLAAWIGTQDMGRGSDAALRFTGVILIIFLGVLVHELGHAFAGRWFGYEPAVELHGLGGLTSWRDRRTMTPLRSIVVSLAGPFAGFALGGLVFALSRFVQAPEGSVGELFIERALIVNIGWGLFNLLPMLPLDGGNVLASLAELVAPRRGRIFARYVSFVVLAVLAGLLVLVSKGGSLGFFTLFLLGLFAYSNYRGLVYERQLLRSVPEAPGEEEAFAALAGVQEAIQRGDAARLFRIADEVDRLATSPRTAGAGLRVRAWGHLFENDAVEAQRLLNALPSGAPFDDVLQGAILLERGSPEQAVRHLERALEEGGGDISYRLLLRGLVELERWDDAVARLESAPAWANRGESADVVASAARSAGREDVVERVNGALARS